MEGALIPLDMPPSAEFVAHLHAAAKLGAVAAPTRQGAAPPSPDAGKRPSTPDGGIRDV